MANKNRPFVVCIIFVISKFLRKVKQKIQILKMFTTFISKMSNDALKKISDDGIDTIKSIVEKQKK